MLQSDHEYLEFCRRPPARWPFAGDDWFDRAARVIATYLQRSCTRRALPELSDQHLRDIGLSRSVEEIGKPFWQ